MKTYTFEFSIGDEPWTILHNKVQRVVVYKHIVNTAFRDTMKGTYIIRELEGTIEHCAHSHELFDTKQKLLETL